MTQTTIEPNKVQLAEKDIEDWLWENPQALRVGGLGHPIEKWIGRQVKLPSGTADLIGIFKSVIVVVEVKNVELTADALTQVCRYANDIEIVKHKWNLERVDENLGDDEFVYLQVWKVVVFKGGVTNKLQYEADALEIELHSFEVNLSLDITGYWRWSKEQQSAHDAAREELAKSDIFDEVKDRALAVYAEHVKRFQDAQAEREAETAEDEPEPPSDN